MSYLPRSVLEEMGFAQLGDNVLISSKASIYGAERIEIGGHIRIDDYCVLSAGAGGIVVGDFVHIAVYTSLIGAGRIQLGDFSNLSSRVSVFSSSDDYSGASMTNPTVPDEYKRVNHAAVRIAKHVIVGSGSVILPGVTLGEGAAIGALSLVRKNCDEYGIYAGSPARRIGERRRDLLALERKFLESTALDSSRR